MSGACVEKGVIVEEIQKRIEGLGNGSPEAQASAPSEITISPSFCPSVRPSFGEDNGARAPPALGVHPPGESAAGSAGCRPRLRGPGRWEMPSSRARSCVGCPLAPRPTKAPPCAAAGRAMSSRTAPRSRPRAAARARWVGKGRLRRRTPAPRVPSHPGPRTRALCSARHGLARRDRCVGVRHPSRRTPRGSHARGARLQRSLSHARRVLCLPQGERGALGSPALGEGSGEAPRQAPSSCLGPLGKLEPRLRAPNTTTTTTPHLSVVTPAPEACLSAGLCLEVTGLRSSDRELGLLAERMSWGN